MTKKCPQISYYIDAAGLWMIGLLCLGYVTWRSVFAESRITIDFLDFPIFVGEIIMFFCIILYIFKIFYLKQPLNKLHAVVLSYLISVVFAALWGYVHYGPLALRHSALFYYPVFIFFGYSFYRDDFLDEMKIWLILIGFLLFFITRYFHDHWTFSILLLSVVLISSLKDRRHQIIFCLLFLYFTPYVSILSGSRMVLVSNALTVFTLTLCLFFIPKWPKHRKINVSAFIVITVIIGFFFIDRSALRSLTSFSYIIRTFREYNQIINQKKDSFELQAQKNVTLYNPSYEEMTREITHDRESAFQKVKKQIMKPTFKPENRVYEAAVVNSLFRLFIWRDMIEEFLEAKAVFGFGFGKPLLSPSLGMLNWGESEWRRDGWIASHNSYLNIIYRTGVLGVFLIVLIGIMLIKLIQKFMILKSVQGLLLCGVIMISLVSANFLDILESPFTSIPLWFITGITLAFYKKQDARLKAERGYKTKIF